MFPWHYDKKYSGDSCKKHGINNNYLQRIPLNFDNIFVLKVVFSYKNDHYYITSIFQTFRKILKQNGIKLCVFLFFLFHFFGFCFLFLFVCCFFFCFNDLLLNYSNALHFNKILTYFTKKMRQLRSLFFHSELTSAL